MNTIAATLGVRLDVPFKDLTNKEKDIVLHGEKKNTQLIFTLQLGESIAPMERYMRMHMKRFMHP